MNCRKTRTINHFLSEEGFKGYVGNQTCNFIISSKTVKMPPKSIISCCGFFVERENYKIFENEAHERLPPPLNIEKNFQMIYRASNITSEYLYTIKTKIRT